MLSCTFFDNKIQLLAKCVNTHSYFIQLPYHPSFSVFLKISKSHIISMHVVSFQNYSIFYNSFNKCIEQGVFRIERIIFSRYYVLILEKCCIKISVQQIIQLLQSFFNEMNFFNYSKKYFSK